MDINENAKGIGGVSIISRMEVGGGGDIKEIHSKTSRRTSSLIQTELKYKKIQIINTYAPHTGYGKTEQMAYWGDIQERLKNMHQKQCAIWTAEYNGQIAYGQNNSDNINEIGPWTYDEKQTQLEPIANSKDYHTVVSKS